MQFSIIIPVYNRRDLVEETLRSIFAQTESDYEIIIVDDGSTDGTAEYLETTYPSIRLLRQKNGGPGAARNHGARAANGEYLAFLDSDDLWFPWALEVYQSVIRETGASFIAGTPHRFQDTVNLEAVARGERRLAKFDDYLASYEQWRWWGMSSMVIRRQAYLATEGQFEGFTNAEDADLALQLGSAPGFVHVESPLSFAYREHGGNITGDPKKVYRGIDLMVRKEAEQRYPGGAERRKERRAIITRHVRPAVLSLARAGARKEAWSLYKRSFFWNLGDGRLRYLCATPLMLITAALRKG